METLNQEVTIFLKAEGCISSGPCHTLHARRIAPEAIDRLYHIIFPLKGSACLPADPLLCKLLKNERIE